MQALEQVLFFIIQLKSILIKDIASFNNVVQRYQILSDKDKEAFNIMNDA